MTCESPAWPADGEVSQGAPLGQAAAATGGAVCAARGIATLIVDSVAARTQGLPAMPRLFLPHRRAEMGLRAKEAFRAVTTIRGRLREGIAHARPGLDYSQLPLQAMDIFSHT